jgi:pimeloyl-ACP methyl ester carboxylesterase
LPPETQAAWEAARGKPPQDYARETMPRSFAPGWTDAHPREFEEILQRRLEFPTPPANWAAQYDACAAYAVEGIDATKIAVPATVIHGRLDRVVPQHNGQVLARQLPRARFVDLPEAGHLPQLEDPARFVRLLREHLGSNEGR